MPGTMPAARNTKMSKITLPSLWKPKEAPNLSLGEGTQGRLLRGGDIWAESQGAAEQVDLGNG